MNVAAIRSELATALRAAITGLTVYDVITPAPNLPAAHIGPPITIDYHPGYGSERRLRLRVLLEVSRNDHRRAQRLLDEYLSWPGVPSALEQYSATNWSDLSIVQVGEARAVGDESTPTLAVDVTVDITT